jgi:ubiquinone/menaquinone biosynthesis C-methylase UbiE|eukprot:COSAG02_NODE_7303_length_3075_cov_2.418683_3_plen_231_part_00
MEHCSDVLQSKPSKAKAANYEEWMSDPVEARLYTESQHSGSTGPARGLSKKIPEILGECRELLDVGGGSGGFSITLAKQWPELHCTVLDFPNVCAVGRDFVEKDEMVGRVDFLEGNAVTTPFPADKDAVLMSYISSSVGEEDLSVLYNKAYAALRPGGSIFIHDFMVEDDRTGPPLAALWALQHMVFTPGAISITPSHLTGLLEGQGFEDVKVWEMIPGLTKVAVATKPL